MKYSKMFGRTEKKVSADMVSASHRLLYKGGYVRESTAGRYYFLPLGWKVFNKIASIVREEMNKAGAQEMIAPVLHPLELWKETNRTNEAGFELMRIKDRRGSEFALGGTAEEMFVDLVRKYQLSYKDLPFNIYQLSTKFRDELRARGGLLRVREFVMKDAYSFHVDEEDFKKEYENMRTTYMKIFNRLGLDPVVVESDNGYIGGEYCHEFVVESDAGESKFFVNEDRSYAAHEDVAKFIKYKDLEPEDMKPREDVEGVGMIGVAPLAQHLKIPVEKTTKTLLFETEKGEVVAAAVNGIYDINEAKLKKILHCTDLHLTNADKIKELTGSEVGYAGILNLPSSIKVILDDSLKGRMNFECGANKTNFHSININFGRDLPEPSEFYDIAMAKEGHLCIKGGTLQEKKGIEVGNIFQLGYHYSKLMKGADFTDRDGKRKPYYMGCYGIGLGRTMATIVEKYHTENSITWPETLAPYDYEIIGIDMDKPEAYEKANNLYNKMLSEGKDVLFDDRIKTTAGEKFADADLIGAKEKIVVSQKSS